MIPAAHRVVRRALGAVALASLLATSSPSEAARPVVGMRRARVAPTEVTAPSDRGTVKLTIDPDLQRRVMSLLQGAHSHEAGAIVIDVRTGRILAWASVDPAGRDMVSQPYAPPASIFKIVTAAALVERAHVPLEARQCYVGGERTARVADLRPNGSGPGVKCETLYTALGYSRNLVVGGLARKHLDSEALETTARVLGMGGEIPIDVHVDKGRVEVPSDEEGLLRASAGFGAGKMSPLEAAYMMTIIARGGSRPVLRLMDNGSAEPAADAGLAMRPSTARALTRMLEVTVREGTCAKVFREARSRPPFRGMRIAAKTGTLARSDPNRLYSWFTAFAPSDHPEVAVAVMLANDQRWWLKGNQVGREVLRAYFEKKRSSSPRRPR